MSETDIARIVPFLALVLAGCVSPQVPRAISQAPETRVSVEQAQQAPERYRGRRVRWGGTILQVHNRERTTEILLLSRPLDGSGEPRGEESGEGRFIALLEGFADPADYPEQRLLTVTGLLEGIETRPVGDYPYPYPVVRVTQSYLWPPPPRPPLYYPDPWYYPWYDPWYYPWYRPWYY